MAEMNLKLMSSTENIRLVENFIDDARERIGFNESIYGNILIAVTESVSNAIIHGNSQDPKKTIDLGLDISEKQVRFTITDQGSGFAHDQLPDPTSPENILEPGGRGVFLMRNLADELEFLNEGRTTRLVFYINGKSAKA